ncbi:hypothetical protein MNEG_10324 [Monoraphidium neglectum]|uniref:Uncharacterized protein n=1 Tax=Monoraphidium neglectum TaxID=145388 RepID=A0A0D2M1Y5_9CHLO|nr:hypothetical protein MNEG_10324 [Monoraphidium neglectum]KIY97639.1 hypothetical protein MNEG_10324 [Monoraphidium neglectum]|eukprot:XP_013896659.1 hypothetical protein MNEG_10324 [Monoraphidium neglectum]
MQQLSCLRPRLQTVSVPRRCSAGLQPLRLANRAHLNRLRTAAADGAESVAAPQEEVDIEDEVEAFMKRQAELESGEAFARTRDPEKIIGADLVSEEVGLPALRALRTLW